MDSSFSSWYRKVFETLSAHPWDIRARFTVAFVVVAVFLLTLHARLTAVS